MNSWTNK